MSKKISIWSINAAQSESPRSAIEAAKPKRTTPMMRESAGEFVHSSSREPAHGSDQCSAARYHGNGNRAHEVKSFTGSEHAACFPGISPMAQSEIVTDLICLSLSDILEKLWKLEAVSNPMPITNSCHAT